MIQFWPEHSFQLYKNACEMLSYPDIPFGSYLRKEIKESDTVLDIGCGFGFTSMYIAPLCQKVIALDQDTFALSKLEEMMKQKGIHNISLKNGVCPDVDIQPVDVIVAFYVFNPNKGLTNMNWLQRICKRAGFINVAGSRPRESFHDALSQRLAIPSRKSTSASASEVFITELENAGFHVNVHEIAHEFGQPIKDLEEAVSFLAWQVNANQTHLPLIKEIASEYIENKNGQYYIPLKRYSQLLHFER